MVEDKLILSWSSPTSSKVFESSSIRTTTRITSLRFLSMQSESPQVRTTTAEKCSQLRPQRRAKHAKDRRAPWWSESEWWATISFLGCQWLLFGRLRSVKYGVTMHLLNQVSFCCPISVAWRQSTWTWNLNETIHHPITSTSSSRVIVKDPHHRYGQPSAPNFRLATLICSHALTSNWATHSDS